VYVERLLQINVATTCALASLLLGMGRQSAIMPLGVMVAAMLSVWLTDFKGWFSLNRTVGGMASIGAVVASISWPVELEKVAMIATVANFLVYVQVIHLFQRKLPRIYWALIRFSVLQVLVAALLVQGAFFGLLLAVYLFVALGALTLLFLHCERLRHAGSASLAPVASGLRWPLAGRVAEFAVPPPGKPALQRELFRRVLRIGVSTIALSMLVFFTVPRIGGSTWHGAGLWPRQSVGFSDQVALGELGKILQSPQEVLRVRFYHDLTNEPYLVPEGVYLRGAVLRVYQTGKWSNPPNRSRKFPDFLALPALRIGRPAVRQRIRIEAMSRDEVFCVWPFGALDADHPDPHLRFDQDTGRLSRKRDYGSQRFEFELRTSAFANGEQCLLYPNEEGLSDLDLRDLVEMPSGPGPTPLPRLVSLASHWTAELPASAKDRNGVARHLESRLRDSGQFTYSLQGQMRDSDIDPIEDFIANNPRGHCEYFATALVLMARSQGVPARMVVGYRTDEWNDLGRFFQVRQLHAHTWVEAYLRREDLPLELAGDPQWAKGGWLRLDATPGSDAAEPAGVWRHGVRRAREWLEFLWGTYVLDMDRTRQHEAIYNPILEPLKTTWENLTSPGWWQDRFRGLTRALGLSRWDEQGVVSIVLAGAVVVLAAVLVLVIAYAIRRFLLTRLLGALFGRSGPAGRRAAVQVEFYRRFETVLARHGLVRPASRTQREFAVWAGRELAQRAGDQRLALLPVQVAEAFYRVRFGRADLDKPQRDAVEQALSQLEQAPRGNKS
jgi:hypothetical protein